MIITYEERETILKNMVKVLDEYDYNYTTDALYKIIDTWATQKEDLIALFKNHPNYVEGKFLIAFNKDWAREIDVNGSARFTKWIRENIETINNNLPDYVKKIIDNQALAYSQSLYYFNREYPLSLNADFLYWEYDTIARQFVDEYTEEKFNRIDPSLRIRAGQKMSRAVNKLCKWLGIDKLPDYNKEFAKYSDSVNPLKIVRHTVLSINPLDYLTMSFGNSWASCHTIDKENVRDMPNSYEGQYSSGTISYMLDKVSMVFYTVSADYNGNEYFFEDKINRNMFHYGNDKLVQGRVYPQDNDESSDIYKDIREIVQKVMADCLGIPNYWTTKKGVEAIKPYTVGEGTNYKDYRYYENCCISFPKEMEINEMPMTIGHNPICIRCGHTHQVSENIDHCYHDSSCCERCGCVIEDEEDEHWIDGECYCPDCTTYCECCDNYVILDDAYWVESEDRYVCDDCLECYYERCEYCDEYFRRESMTELANGNYVCENCRDNEYSFCPRCAEWYLDVNTHYDEENNATYCDNCWEEIHENEEEN